MTTKRPLLPPRPVTVNINLVKHRENISPVLWASRPPETPIDPPNIHPEEMKRKVHQYFADLREFKKEHINETPRFAHGDNHFQPLKIEDILGNWKVLEEVSKESIVSGKMEQNDIGIMDKSIKVIGERNMSNIETINHAVGRPMLSRSNNQFFNENVENINNRLDDHHNVILSEDIDKHDNTNAVIEGDIHKNNVNNTELLEGPNESIIALSNDNIDKSFVADDNGPPLNDKYDRVNTVPMELVSEPTYRESLTGDKFNIPHIANFQSAMKEEGKVIEKNYSVNTSTHDNNEIDMVEDSYTSVHGGDITHDKFSVQEEDYSKLTSKEEPIFKDGHRHQNDCDTITHDNFKVHQQEEDNSIPKLSNRPTSKDDKIDQKENTSPDIIQNVDESVKSSQENSPFGYVFNKSNRPSQYLKNSLLLLEEEKSSLMNIGGNVDLTDGSSVDPRLNISNMSNIQGTGDLIENMNMSNFIDSKTDETLVENINDNNVQLKNKPKMDYFKIPSKSKKPDPYESISTLRKNLSNEDYSKFLHKHGKVDEKLSDKLVHNDELNINFYLLGELKSSMILKEEQESLINDKLNEKFNIEKPKNYQMKKENIIDEITDYNEGNSSLFLESSHYLKKSNVTVVEPNITNYANEKVEDSVSGKSPNLSDKVNGLNSTGTLVHHDALESSNKVDALESPNKVDTLESPNKVDGQTSPIKTESHEINEIKPLKIQHAKPSNKNIFSDHPYHPYDPISKLMCREENYNFFEKVKKHHDNLLPLEKVEELTKFSPKGKQNLDTTDYSVYENKLRQKLKEFENYTLNNSINSLGLGENVAQNCFNPLERAKSQILTKFAPKLGDGMVLESDDILKSEKYKLIKENKTELYSGNLFDDQSVTLNQNAIDHNELSGTDNTLFNNNNTLLKNTNDNNVSHNTLRNKLHNFKEINQPKYSEHGEKYQPPEKPIEKYTEKPIEKYTEKPLEKYTEKPLEKYTEKPLETIPPQPLDFPTDLSISDSLSQRSVLSISSSSSSTNSRRYRSLREALSSMNHGEISKESSHLQNDERTGKKEFDSMIHSKSHITSEMRDKQKPDINNNMRHEADINNNIKHEPYIKNNMKQESYGENTMTQNETSRWKRHDLVKSYKDGNTSFISVHVENNASLHLHMD